MNTPTPCPASDQLGATDGFLPGVAVALNGYASPQAANREQVPEFAAVEQCPTKQFVMPLFPRRPFRCGAFWLCLAVSLQLGTELRVFSRAWCVPAFFHPSVPAPLLPGKGESLFLCHRVLPKSGRAILPDTLNLRIGFPRLRENGTFGFASSATPSEKLLLDTGFSIRRIV